MDFKTINDYNSKVLELASDLAHLRVTESNCQKIWKDEDSEVLEYTEEAQDLFNEYYDVYEDMVKNIMK